MTASKLASYPALAEEDSTRAAFYALLGRLYTAAPDAPLLAAIGASDLWPDPESNALADAWNRLVLASRVMDAEAAEQEYTDLFVGVGKAECDLHASHWMPPAMRRPLVAVRAELASLGLARKDASAVYEDHLGALCEAMRALIAGTAGTAPQTVAVQKTFFDGHLGGWVDRCCDAIRACPIANYYARVAEFTSSFVAIERDSFAIE